VEQKKSGTAVNINDLKVIWRIISKNWYIPLLIVPIFYVIGYFYVYKLTSISQASVELLKTNDTYYKDNLITDNNLNTQTYIDNSNEIRIVKSFDLMKETVAKLKDRLEVSYYLVGRVRTTEQFTGVPFEVKVNSMNPALKESALEIEIVNYDEYRMKYLKNGLEEIKTGRFNESFIDVDFNLELARSANFTRNTYEELKTLKYQIVVHDLNNLVYSFQRALDVQNPDYTNVLVITLNDIIPERAVLVLDTLSKLYINKSLNSRFEINERTIMYIDKQLEEVSHALKEVEDTMQNYKKQKAILDLEWEKTDFLNKLSEFDAQKSKLKLKIGAINDLEKYIIEDKDPQFLPPNVFIVDSDPFLVSSVGELYSSQIKLNQAFGFLKESNPNVTEIKQNIKRLKQNILVYLENTRNATYKVIENVNGQIASYIYEVKNIPQKQQDILNIQRRVVVNEELYNFLLERRANTRR